MTLLIKLTGLRIEYESRMDEYLTKLHDVKSQFTGPKRQAHSVAKQQCKAELEELLLDRAEYFEFIGEIYPCIKTWRDTGTVNSTINKEVIDEVVCLTDFGNCVGYFYKERFTPTQDEWDLRNRTKQTGKTDFYYHYD